MALSTFTVFCNQLPHPSMDLSCLPRDSAHQTVTPRSSSHLLGVLTKEICAAAGVWTCTSLGTNHGKVGRSPWGVRTQPSVSVRLVRLGRGPPVSLSIRPHQLVLNFSACVLHSGRPQRWWHLPPRQRESDCCPTRCVFSRGSPPGVGSTWQKQSCHTRHGTRACSSRQAGAWSLNSALPPNRGFQTQRTCDRAWGHSGQRGHTAATPLSVQGAFLALPRSLDSWPPAWAPPGRPG